MAPVIFIFTYVYLQDKYDREPLRHLIISFIFGILIAVPAYIGEITLQQILNVHSGADFFETLEYSLIVIALVEEGLKFLVLRFYMYKQREFDEPYDGIMYAVAISLGFAAIENVLYIVDGGLEVAFLRMFTAVPGHAMFAVLMGFYVGLSKFPPEKVVARHSGDLFAKYGGHNGKVYFLDKELSIRKMLYASLTAAQARVLTQRGFSDVVGGVTKFQERISGWRAMTMVKGLVAAILAHGLYDFFLMWNVKEEQNYLPLLAFVVLIVGLVLARRAMKMHQNVSPYQDFPDEDVYPDQGPT